MKANLLPALFALIFSSSILFASNDNNTVVNREMNSSVSISLIPTTPREATFEDATETAVTGFTGLAPVNPVEADFSDAAPELTSDLSLLSPVTPAEADFSDLETYILDIKTLTPFTPAVADFE